MSRLTSRCIGILQITSQTSSKPILPFRLKPKVGGIRRGYATHRDHISPSTASSLLSQHLDQRQNKDAGGRSATDSVGPFQLGINLQSQKQEKVKKWSELSGSGKVGRVTARTTNLTVILVGAGLSAVLVYALATELFARNSPTVLYNDACERIKASPAVSTHLRPPYTFHNHPPLTHRPRHRTRNVNSLLSVDANGKEHLLLNFYIDASDPTAPPPPSESIPLADRISHWASSKVDLISNLTFHDTVEWTKHKAESIWVDTKRAFAYLTGAPLPSVPRPAHPQETYEGERQVKQREPELFTLSGMFGRIVGKKKTTNGQKSEVPKTGMWTTGEVHADLVKNENGDFVYRYLLVNIPDSNSRNPLRVYVERTEGVHENEGIVRWSSH